MCIILSVKVRVYWVQMNSSKFKSIFLLIVFQKEGSFEITWIHFSIEIILFSVFPLYVSVFNVHLIPENKDKIYVYIHVLYTLVCVCI